VPDLQTEVPDTNAQVPDTKAEVSDLESAWIRLNLTPAVGVTRPLGDSLINVRRLQVKRLCVFDLGLG